jgi:8-oxo-dGTP diphosphatase
MIELAGNLIVEGGKVLLIYRSKEEYWEVPGGKVENDESPTQAAVREAEEEIGIEFELEKPFYTGEFMKDGDLYMWHGYIASTEESPSLEEEKFSDLKWVAKDELQELELAPNLRQIEPALRKILN